MKKFITALTLTLFIYSGHAQIVVALMFGDKLNTGKIEFGMIVSPGLTNITNMSGESRLGLNLGIYLNIRPDKRFFLHAEGIGKAAFGSASLLPYPTNNDSLDNLFENGSVRRNIQAFSLPLLGRYRLYDLLFADIGIQANLRLKATDVFKSTVNENDLEYTVNTSGQYTRLDMGFAGGLFYKFKNDKKSMGIGIRYFQGITDIYKAMDGKQVNTAWFLTATIPIGTGKQNSSSVK